MMPNEQRYYLRVPCGRTMLWRIIYNIYIIHTSEDIIPYRRRTEILMARCWFAWQTQLKAGWGHQLQTNEHAAG